MNHDKEHRFWCVDGEWRVRSQAVDTYCICACCRCQALSGACICAKCQDPAHGHATRYDVDGRAELILVLESVLHNPDNYEHTPGFATVSRLVTELTNAIIAAGWSRKVTE